jgi:hypothetical protein
MAIMAACVGLGLALAAAPDDAGVPLWRAVAIAAVAVLAGWAAPHLVTIPGLTHARGHWDSMPGAAAAGMAAVCLGVTVVAARPGLKALRGVAIALVVAIALAPPAGAFLFSVGPGLTGGQAVLASGGHIHAVGSGENAIVFQPGPNGGRYVYKAKAPAHETALGIALIVAAAAVFTYGAVGYLRGRTAPRESAVAGDIERGLA